METAKTIVVIAAVISVFASTVFAASVCTELSTFSQMVLASALVTVVWAGGLFYALSRPGPIGPLCTGVLGVLGLLWGLGGRLTALLLIVAAIIAYKDYKRQAKAAASIAEGSQ